MLARTMGTAIELSIANFHTMPNDLDSAVRAPWCHLMDRAFKAIECTALTCLDDLKGLVIFISTDVTLSHLSSFLKWGPI